MNSAMRPNGPRRSARSFLAFSTMSSLGSSTTFLATALTAFQLSRNPCGPVSPNQGALLPERPSPIDVQGGQDSNLQPAVLETAALPIEPPPSADSEPGHASPRSGSGDVARMMARRSLAEFNYLDQCR